MKSYPGAGSTLDGHLAGHDGQDLGALFADVVEPLERLVRVAALALQTAPEQNKHTDIHTLTRFFKLIKHTLIKL